jgi:hypothetical protein
MYEELAIFFIDQTTSTSSLNAQLFKSKVDSIQRELNAVRKMYAQQTDQSLGLLLQQDKVDLKALSVKESMLNVMYAEALRNYESYQYVSQAALPSLTLIDYPYSPIKLIKKSVLVYAILLAFVLLSLSFIFIRFKIWLRAIIRI